MKLLYNTCAVSRRKPEKNGCQIKNILENGQQVYKTFILFCLKSHEIIVINFKLDSFMYNFIWPERPLYFKMIKLTWQPGRLSSACAGAEGMSLQA
jgi:hypothetical protein